MNQAKNIILFGLVSSILLLLAEQWLDATYLIKSILKIFLFFVCPLIFMYTSIKSNPINLLKPFYLPFKTHLLVYSLGMICITIILISYAFIGYLVNWDLLLDDVQNRLGVTPAIFPYVAIYITFGNSFLEEWFFRGFLHLKLSQLIGHWPASLLSAGLFSFYHLAMFITWFDWTVLILCLLALFITGLVLNELNRKQQTINASWIVHILADIGIMIIGFIIFY